MTDNHPITPPPELVEQWRNLPEYVSQLRTMSTVTITTERLQHIATRAAQWGADQELEVCCEWIAAYPWLDHPELLIKQLRAARRPKPPSLKEQALAAARRFYAKGHEDCTDEEVKDDFDVLRRALEQLDDSL